MHRYVSSVSMMILLALMVVATGCGGKTRKGAQVATDTDTLGPTSGEYDANALGPRLGEDGERVTDVSVENVQFGYNQYDIGQSEVAKIETVAQYMQQNPNTHLIAEGHADERGSREYNVALGEHRAQAVRAYLISLGIDGGRVQTRSYGEERPLDPGHAEASWTINRRVEPALYK